MILLNKLDNYLEQQLPKEIQIIRAFYFSLNPNDAESNSDKFSHKKMEEKK